MANRKIRFIDKKYNKEIDDPGFPSDIAVSGRDDSTGEFFRLYFDGVNYQETGHPERRILI